ncbi:MAG: hypothetical protein WBQ14_01740 [Gaiellaceae bacterium]
MNPISVALAQHDHDATGDLQSLDKWRIKELSSIRASKAYRAAWARYLRLYKKHEQVAYKIARTNMGTHWREWTKLNGEETQLINEESRIVKQLGLQFCSYYSNPLGN